MKRLIAWGTVRFDVRSRDVKPTDAKNLETDMVPLHRCPSQSPTHHAECSELLADWKSCVYNYVARFLKQVLRLRGFLQTITPLGDSYKVESDGVDMQREWRLTQFLCITCKIRREEKERGRPRLGFTRKIIIA